MFNPLLISVIILAITAPFLKLLEAKNEIEKLEGILRELDPCVIKSIYSNIEPLSFLPTNLEELRRSCTRHTEGIQCIKVIIPRIDNIVLKRGISTLIRARQRQQKKVCTNPQSRVTRQFLEATSCVMNKRRKYLVEADKKFTYKLQYINRQRNNASLELKQLCCAVIDYRKSFNDSPGPECAAHKSIVEETVASIIVNDINFICPDEDKFNEEICPSLKPIEIKEPSRDLSQSAPRLSLFLVSTLGDRSSN